jgi:hypothetical protein
LWLVEIVVELLFGKVAHGFGFGIRDVELQASDNGFVSVRTVHEFVR